MRLALFSEWETEVEHNLKSMRAFVPLWTDAFESSKWAIMESTFAWFNRDSINDCVGYARRQSP